MTPAGRRAKASRATPGELVERLCIESPPLVDAVYDVALRQLRAEDEHRSRLDAKAQGLLATAGITIAVASAFGGGLLLQRKDFGSETDSLIARTAVAAVVAALVFGLAASASALRAIWVRASHHDLDEDEYLSKDELRDADALEGAAGPSRYKRYLIVHMVRVRRQNLDANEAKAQMILWGQTFFALFLGSVLALGAITILTAR